MKKLLLLLLVTYVSTLCSCESSEPKERPSQIISHVPKKISSSTSPIVNTGKSSEEAYEMLHVVFKGQPELASIRKLMHPVMTMYNMEENYENLNRCGSALLAMRKSSAVGVTEMEILKHMYQYGSNHLTFAEQVALSATILEGTR